MLRNLILISIALFVAAQPSRPVSPAVDATLAYLAGIHAALAFLVIRESLRVRALLERKFSLRIETAK